MPFDNKIIIYSVDNNSNNIKPNFQRVMTKEWTCWIWWLLPIKKYKELNEINK